MHCETQQHGLPRLLTEAQTLDAPMTEARIRRAMNLPSQSRRVNISNASPLWVSEIDGITFFPALVPTALAGQTRLAALVLPVELMHTPFAAKSGLMRRS
jgi:hypothetical protein